MKRLPRWDRVTKLTPGLAPFVKRLRAEGVSTSEIAVFLNVRPAFVRCWLDPEHDRRVRERLPYVRFDLEVERARRANFPTERKS